MSTQQRLEMYARLVEADKPLQAIALWLTDDELDLSIEDAYQVSRIRHLVAITV